MGNSKPLLNWYSILLWATTKEILWNLLPSSLLDGAFVLLFYDGTFTWPCDH